MTTIEKRRRLPANESRTAIVDAAMRLAKRHKFAALRQVAIAEEAGVSSSLIPFHFGSMDKLRDEVMRRAVADGVSSIIAEGLAAGNRIALRAPDDVKRAALDRIVNKK